MLDVTIQLSPVRAHLEGKLSAALKVLEDESRADETWFVTVVEDASHVDAGVTVFRPAGERAVPAVGGWKFRTEEQKGVEVPIYFRPVSVFPSQPDDAWIASVVDPVRTLLVATR